MLKSYCSSRDKKVQQIFCSVLECNFYLDRDFIPNMDPGKEARTNMDPFRTATLLGSVAEPEIFLSPLAPRSRKSELWFGSGWFDTLTPAPGPDSLIAPVLFYVD